jgi:hypothetical protein
MHKPNRADGGQRTVNAKAKLAGDRFAGWEPVPARLLLGALLALLVLAALSPVTAGRGERAPRAELTAAGPATVERFDDLRLYDAVIVRLQRGEHYYDVIAEEHRKLPFPLTPGMAVRLPTLAYLAAWLGKGGLIAASFVLVGAILLAWWRRLGAEPGGAEHRLLAMALLMLGISFILTRYFHVLHELWAGGLLALAFALHRPGRWGPALAVAALALAIRELALPFVLLMAAMAAWRRDWRETAAWSALALAFVALWAWHLSLIAAQVRPGDPVGPSWLSLRGMTGLTSAYVLSTSLRFVPHVLAGPLVVLMLLGWGGWRSAAGAFGTFLFLGYGLLFMIAGRPENWYWGAMVSQTALMGLAFAPRAVVSLLKAAR